MSFALRNRIRLVHVSMASVPRAIRRIPYNYSTFTIRQQSHCHTKCSVQLRMASRSTKYFQTMSSTTASTDAPPPQSSALPPSHHAPDSQHNTPDSAISQQTPLAEQSKVIPQRKPLLRLELRDLSSSGSRAFLRLVHASTALQDAVDTVLKLLYKDMHASCIPPTRSVTLVLRDMEGVAYTTGLDLDDDHKEIHLSTKYIEFVPESRQKEEILGVLVHEMVHCWQHSAYGQAPGGLVEGIADWVRLKAGYAPPHWKRHVDCDWDAGYERTGYFLEWLEEEHGADVVRRINEAMRDCEYDAHRVWFGCCGKSVDDLWEEYKKSVGKDDGKDEEKNEADAEQEEKKAANEEPEAEKEEAQAVDGEPDQSAPQEDGRADRNKARRGGNIHIPIRPKFS